MNSEKKIHFNEAIWCDPVEDQGYRHIGHVFAFNDL